MKLELKHLAPYLPYGLIVGQYREDLKITFFSKMVELSSDRIRVTLSRFPFSEIISYYEAKPILRPLSDLSSLEKDDIIINEHTINLIIGENGVYGKVCFCHYKGDLDLTYESDSSQRYDSEKSIDFKTFNKVMDELLKGHYDVFGLIQSGLAIDINTLSKEG